MSRTITCDCGTTRWEDEQDCPNCDNINACELCGVVCAGDLRLTEYVYEEIGNVLCQNCLDKLEACLTHTKEADRE